MIEKTLRLPYHLCGYVTRGETLFFGFHSFGLHTIKWVAYHL